MPASKHDSEPPHTDAIELEPFDSSTSDTMRIVYGNPASAAARPESRARRDCRGRASRRLVPRIGRTSPVEERREVVVEHERLRSRPFRRSSPCAARHSRCRASRRRAPASGRAKSTEPCARQDRGVDRDGAHFVRLVRRRGDHGYREPERGASRIQCRRRSTAPMNPCCSAGSSRP